MKFRDDIDLANTWLVSDTHFGHDNIVGYSHRPDDHEQVMIAEWRKEVPENGTVLHLGDLCYSGNARFKNLTAKELTGERKLLIQGNHDKQRFSFYRDSGFRIVKPFALRLKMQDGELAVTMPGDGHWNWTVSFSHYPWSEQEESRPLADTDLRIHGHIHNSGYTREHYLPFLKGHINLSVEQTKYKPVNLKRLLDAVLLGQFEGTSEASIAEARMRRAKRKPS